MCPPPKYSLTRRQAPHQGLVEVGEPFRLASSQRHRLPEGGRSLSPATPHTKCKWSRERKATFPPGEAGEGEGRADTTPAVTTPCSASTNFCRVASDRLSAARPIGAPPPPVSPCGGWGVVWAAGCNCGKGGWGWLLPQPLRVWAPQRVLSKPHPLWGRVSSSPSSRIVWVRGRPQSFCQGSPPMLRGMH